MSKEHLAVYIDNITKSYTNASRVVVFQDATLTIDRGEFLGVFAPSGMGKTTLILLLAGILKPDRGRIIVLGKDFTSMTRKELTLFRRKHIGIVFQFFNLIPQLTVIENVLFPMELNNTPHDQALRRAYELLEFIGLKDKAKQFPNSLSGGEQQRVAIARAVAHNPDIILADEPTGNLDEKNKHIIFDLFKRINEEWNRTIIVATHDVELASRYVSRGVKIRNRKFIEYP